MIEVLFSENMDFGPVVEMVLAPTLQRVGEAQKENIKRRASMGIGVDDRVMPTKRDGALRTLRHTGQMLASMSVQTVQGTSEGLEVSIIFTNSQALHKARDNQARTPWFGISPSDAEALRTVWQTG